MSMGFDEKDVKMKLSNSNDFATFIHSVSCYGDAVVDGEQAWDRNHRICAGLVSRLG